VHAETETANAPPAPINGNGMNASRMRAPTKYCVKVAPIWAPMAAPVCMTKAIIISTLPFSAWVKVPYPAEMIISKRSVPTAIWVGMPSK